MNMARNEAAYQLHKLSEQENLKTSLEIHKKENVDHILDLFSKNDAPFNPELLLDLLSFVSKKDNVSLVDSRTGALNAKAVEDFAKSNLKFVNTRHVYFIDFDEFKQKNDEFGHGPVDELIKGFVDNTHNFLRSLKNGKFCESIDGGCLIRSMTDHNFLIRNGGDEFVLVLDSFIPIETLRSALELEFEIIPERTVKQKISIGHSFCSHNDLRKSIHSADLAMLDDKKRRSAGR